MFSFFVVCLCAPLPSHIPTLDTVVRPYCLFGLFYLSLLFSQFLAVYISIFCLLLGFLDLFLLSIFALLACVRVLYVYTVLSC